ncbi:MAG: FecR domain-containing protein, partial [Acidobacteriota bacterium]
MGEPPQTAADWTAKLRSDRATEQDRADYEEWLAEDPGNRVEAEGLDDLWQSLEGLEGDPMVQAVLAAPPREPRRRWFNLPAPALMGTVAFSLALVAASWMLWSQLGAFDVHRTGSGEQRLVELADGSTLHLNVSTELEVALRKGLRTVRLVQGQAFFDVASD